MVAFALNVRAEQFNALGSAVRLPRTNLQRAIDMEGQRILLYAGRTDSKAGYFGTVVLGESTPDRANQNFFWLCLHELVNFDRSVTLKDLRALGIAGEMPFHAYADALRQVDRRHVEALISLHVVELAFGEPTTPFEQEPGYTATQVRVRSRAVRFQMLEAYEARCSLSDRVFPSLDGLRSCIDVGHLRPLYANGPDIIQNVLPMSKDANWHWDEGVISLTSDGRILIATKAAADTRKLFSGGKQIYFPADPQLWPDAKFLEFHRDVIFEKGRPGHPYAQG